MRKKKVEFKKKLWNGEKTAEDVHKEFVGRKCMCGGHGSTVIRSFASVSELLSRSPDVYGALIAQGRRPFKTAWKDVQFILIGEVVACDRCSSAAERAAAKHPSWVYVDVRKPKPDRRVFQVPNTDNGTPTPA